jgi:hypothetical protein
MRKLLLGLFAASTIGCGAGPSIGGGSAALNETPPPPNPNPPWCADCPDRAIKRTSLWRPVFDPLQLASDYGRPELAPEIARRAAVLSGKLDRVTTVAEAEALVAAFTADLDLLAQ